MVKITYSRNLKPADAFISTANNYGCETNQQWPIFKQARPRKIYIIRSKDTE
jgi:hypothetical protein